MTLFAKTLKALVTCVSRGRRHSKRTMENTDKVVEKATAAKDTPAAVCERFFKLVTELFSFLEELNDYVACETLSSPPVPAVMITIVKNLIATVPHNTKAKAVEVFFERAFPHTEKIIGKNVDHFISIAPELFPEIPVAILNQVVGIVKSPIVPKDSVNDTFDFVVSMLRISTKYMCITAKVPPSKTDEIIKLLDSV